MKVLKICSVVIGVLMVAAGLYCIFNPGVTYLGIGYVIGVSMLLDAVGRIYAWWQLKREGQADGLMLVGGILSAVFGVILISDAAVQFSVDVFIAYMAACWILILAVITIIRAFRAWRFHKNFDTIFLGKHWWISMIIGVLMCIFAILSLLNPGVIMTSIGIFIGLGIITAGANILTFALTPAKAD